ncbi:YjgN family protein [Qipengyuania sp. DGS5-3]|uniref:YjgN family protein n=1 Tax=Qipengyuania sp. DGS5-3 TaxID=3349632 RepID=UPI0036D34D08
MEESNGQADSAFAFEGTWQEFAPIAFTNLLLTIVTLGIYRFWATTRERQYLWSRSRFVDENLEWAGTGKELFFGFLIVAVVLLLPFSIITLITQGAIFRGYEGLAALITLTMFIVIFYFTGVARYRALRYRLSRTRWRGIRGGSDDQGFTFGLSYMWKNMAGYFTAGLLTPWAMVSLWNERWSKMSFGPHKFEAYAESGEVLLRFLLFYLAPFLIFVAGGIAALLGAGAGYGLGGEEGAMAGGMFGIFIGLLVFYLLIGLIAVAFYSKFYEVVVGGTQWKDLHFEFTASTKDWLILFLGDFALVIFTLGVGYIFLSYRHWKFFMTHMEAGGEIVLDELTQSQTSDSQTGEGLLDAFDVGAI